jgi:hypothetical protein
MVSKSKIFSDFIDFLNDLDLQVNQCNKIWIDCGKLKRAKLEAKKLVTLEISYFSQYPNAWVFGENQELSTNLKDRFSEFCDMPSDFSCSMPKVDPEIISAIHGNSPAYM